MRLEEPRWWQAASGKDSLAARVLSPVGRLYGALVESRYKRHEPYRSRLPVICIGNFTVGGTGKTPLALLVIEYLKTTGRSPVCLTRGYGGRMAGPVWVDAALHMARDVGDEALLIARHAPVVVARDRRAGAKTIEMRATPRTVIVMDDGLQNPALAKDLAIAVVDGDRGIGNGAVIPAGPLRAPLEFQLGLVDCIAVNGLATDTAGGTIFERLKRYFPGPVLSVQPVPAGETAWLAGAPVIAYAGIGHPERFFRLLEGLGARVEVEAPFADHHVFTESDAAGLLGKADALSAMLVTTEKDVARLSGATARCGELRLRSRALPVRLACAERDLSRLTALIRAAIRRPGQDQ